MKQCLVRNVEMCVGERECKGYVRNLRKCSLRKSSSAKAFVRVRPISSHVLRECHVLEVVVPAHLCADDGFVGGDGKSGEDPSG